MALFRRREGLFESGRVLWLPVESLQPNPDQPRQYFAPEGLEELAESIKVHGILQPLSVRRRRLCTGVGGAAAPGRQAGRAP